MMLTVMVTSDFEILSDMLKYLTPTSHVQVKLSTQLYTKQLTLVTFTGRTVTDSNSTTLY